MDADWAPDEVDLMLDHFMGEWQGHGGGVVPLGPQYLLTDDHELVAALVGHSSSSLLGSGLHSSAPATAGSPAATLVGTSGGLQINLVWDASVKSSANWSAVESAVVQAAKVYTSAFSNHAVLNIAVGYGEVAGSALGAGALGESESNGYITSYATVVNALASRDSSLVQSGQMARDALSALQGLHGESFFVTSAQAKVMGLATPTSSGIDGYIGLNTSSQMFFPAAGGTLRASQYDAVGVAAHEISEVMGRIGMEGASLGSHADIYTPLDIFRYSGAHAPDLNPSAGYFSTNDGLSVLNAYNNPANHGDAADWASSSANRINAFDAFSNPGVIDQLAPADLLELAVLGFQPNAGHILSATVTV